MPGLVPDIHALLFGRLKTGMAGTSPAMTWRKRNARYRLIGANFAGSMIEVFCSISRLESSIFLT